MNNLARTPIIDINGKPTHVWKNDGSVVVDSRVQGIIQPPQPQPKSWDEMDVVEKTDRTFDVAYQILQENGLSDWNIALSRAYNILGQCLYLKKTILLSKVMIAHVPWQEVEDTIKHEVAHALTPRAKHGYEWKQAVLALGGNPSRSGEGKGMPPPPARAAKKEMFLNGKKLRVEIGDKVTISDGQELTITEFRRVNVIGVNSFGKRYSMRAAHIERYRVKYEIDNNIENGIDLDS